MCVFVRIQSCMSANAMVCDNGASRDRLRYVLSVGSLRATSISGKCLPPPFDEGKNKNPLVSLRGSDAVFWRDGVDRQCSATECIDYLHYGEELWEEDKENAIEANKMVLESNVQSVHAPAGTVLYHWTDNFPRTAQVHDVVYTHGFLWTSTSDQFVWPRQLRLTIVVPEGTPVYVDPNGHSKRIPCEGDQNDGFERAHNDVLIPPSVFRIVSLEDTHEDRVLMSRSVLENTVGRFNAYLVNYMKDEVSVQLDTRCESHWVIKCHTAATATLLYNILAYAVFPQHMVEYRCVVVFQDSVTLHNESLVVSVWPVKLKPFAPTIQLVL